MTGLTALFAAMMTQGTFGNGNPKGDKAQRFGKPKPVFTKSELVAGRSLPRKSRKAYFRNLKNEYYGGI